MFGILLTTLREQTSMIGGTSQQVYNGLFQNYFMSSYSIIYLYLDSETGVKYNLTSVCNVEFSFNIKMFLIITLVNSNIALSLGLCALSLRLRAILSSLSVL